MSKTRARQPQPPIRHPFIEIAGDVYLMLDWFDLDDGKRSREQISLVRLNGKELEVYDSCRSTADSVGNLLPLVQRRLDRRRAQP